MSLLTIAIPTYNRKDKMLAQISNLVKQDDHRLFEIVVIDNASDFDVYEALSEVNSIKIRVIRNHINIGMSANLVSPFFYARTKWLWIISDDDELLDKSVQCVLNSIETCSNDVGMVKFSRVGYLNKASCARSLEQFTDYYYNNSVVGSGDFVFVSTNVFNLEALKSHIGYSFEYSYTHIGFLIPIIMALDESEKIRVMFSPDAIVRYCSPEGDGWDYFKGAKGLSSIAHLPLSLSKIKKRQFYSIAMAVKYKSLVVRLLDNPTQNRADDLSIVYASIYRYYLSWYVRIPLCNFVFLMKYNAIRVFFSWIWKLKRTTIVK